MIYNYDTDKVRIRQDLYEVLLNTELIPLASESKYTSHKLYSLYCGFDIETYRGFMYIWQFSFFSYPYQSEPSVVLGRTWKDFREFIFDIIAPVTKKGTRPPRIMVNGERKAVNKGELVIGVHNLKYEFQWLRSVFDWSKAFSSDLRSPYYCILGDIEGKMSGIKFIDTLKLYPMPLAKLPKVCNCPVEKLKGDLDYKIPRNSKTILDRDTELQYCINDVVILSYALKYLFENFVIPNKKLPVSQTAQIRYKITQSAKLKQFKHTLKYISECVMTLELYTYLRGQSYDIKSVNKKGEEIFKKQRLGFFEAGLTHANMLHSKKVCKDVYHFDYTSSYPYVMLTQNYPYKITEKYLGENIEDYYFDDRNDFLLEVEFTNISALQTYGVLSDSKCITEKAVLDNGKVLKADKLRLIKTRRELETYMKFYKYDTAVVKIAYHCELYPLPDFVIDNIIEQYKIKSDIKQRGLSKHPDYVNKYNESKQFVNGIFGMFVTEIHLENYDFSDGHNLTVTKIDRETIEKGMKKNPLLAQWGMFVTMYARTRLLEDIKRLGDNFIYSDTDSGFFFYDKEFMDYIERENARIIEDNNARFNEPLLSDIGGYDLEAHCKEFKTCGAKCYIQIFDDDTFEPTIAGIGKKVFIDYCINNNFDPMDLVEECFISEDLTQKLRPEYYDYPRVEEITDCQGHTEKMFEMTSQELIETQWSNSLNEIYSALVDTVQTNLKSILDFE